MIWFVVLILCGLLFGVGIGYVNYVIVLLVFYCLGCFAPFYCLLSCYLNLHAICRVVLFSDWLLVLALFCVLITMVYLWFNSVACILM